MLKDFARGEKAMFDAGDFQGATQSQSPPVPDHLTLAVSVLQAPLSDEFARGEAEKLRAALGTHAASAVLSAQNASLQAGDDDAAVKLLSILTAIWELEDGPA